MAKLTVFIAHIDKYQDLANYLKEQLVAAFPGAIEPETCVNSPC
ncbi:MAG: hypothetical protein NTX53_19435 [candidate division WOR-3 bacterium]|nr:hypothetical protein [candidate division WOR-3 bacterium]